MLSFLYIQRDIFMKPGNGTIKQNLDNHGTVQAGTLYPTNTSGQSAQHT